MKLTLSLGIGAVLFGAILPSSATDRGGDPSVTSVPVTRAQGSASARTVIANVGDAGGAGLVQVTVNGSGAAISNNVEIKSIRNDAGVITALVRAGCPAPLGITNFTLSASNGSNANTALLPISVVPGNNPIWCAWWSQTPDAAPAVTTTTPSMGAAVANNVALAINFSEPVDATNAVTLTCGGPNLITGGASGTDVSVLNPTYAAPLPSGACVLTVIAAAISDSDLADPPQNPVSNTLVNFLVDAAPAFVSATPAAGATVATGQSVSFTFDQNVANLGNAITLDCAGAVTGTISGDGTPTLTFTPKKGLSAGTSCTATAVAAQIGDSDGVDPPQNPAADVTRSFSVDGAPAVTTTVPANGASSVAVSADLRVNFNELVNFTGAAFTLNCPAATAIPFTVSGSGSNQATIDPTADLPTNSACVLSIDGAQIQDVDTLDPPNAGVGITTVNFSTTAGNDAAPRVLTVTPNNGGVTGTSLSLMYTFDEPVSVGANAVSLDCGNGASTYGSVASNVTSYNAVISAVIGAGESCTATLESTLISDSDAVDPPNELDGNSSGDATDGDADDFTSTFTIDSAPTVTTVSPAGGASNVATDTALIANFSEAVNVSATGITLSCVPGGAVTGTVASIDADSYRFTPGASLPSPATCTGTVVAAEVTDTDSFDPPQNLAENFTWSFTTIDAAPTVSSAAVEVANVFTNLPLGAGTFADPDADVRVTFSEAVNPTGTWATLVCTNSGTQSVGSGLVVTAADPVFTLNPTTNLVPGESCTFAVIATQVIDDDAIDPPEEMAADAVFNFVVRDAAPTVTIPSPAAAATVPDSQTVTLNFSEPVNVAAGGIAFNCGAAVTFTPALPQNNVSTLTLTPASALTNGAACTVTLESTLITDVDAIDPPNELDGNNSGDIIDGDADDVTRSFTVDQAPNVTTTLPAGGATNQNPTSNITINFNESVIFDTAANAANTSFDLECPGGSPANFTVSTASPAASVVINPDDNAIAGRTCVLTVQETGISDNDSIDPPNNMLVDFTATIGFGAIANDDARAVTPHLTNTTALGAAELDSNDIIGSGVITSFGFGSCTGTTAGAQLDAGIANGRLTINANGTFSYEPPANVASATRTFCYTVTGGDTANVAFNIANTELVWFVDAAAPASGIGTQARPFQTLTAAVAVDTNDDTIFVRHNASGYTCGFGLLPNERLIGEGSGSNLSALSGVTPVTGSVFPALTNNSAQWPTLSASNADCVAISTSNTIRGFNFGNVGTNNNVIAGSGFVTLLVTDAAIATNGQALNLSNGTLAATFNSVSSTGGAFNVRLNSVSGTADLGTGALSGAFGGTAFAVSGFSTATNTVAVTYSGSITGSRAVDIQTHSVGDITLSGALLSTSANAAINIANNISGTITLSGTSKVFASGGNPAVVLANNAGATINFTGGGLDIDTTGGTGFSATGGGTVSVQGSGNSITSTTGAALIIDHASPQATNLTFASIVASAGTSTHGILLDNISGAVTVTGTTAIGPKTTAGIEITNSSATIALSSASTVSITNRPNIGIRIASSSGTIGFGNTTINSTTIGVPAIRIDASSSAVTFAQANIDMGGAGGNETFEIIGSPGNHDAYTPRDNAGDGDAIYVTGLTGSLAINGGTITRPGDDGIDIRSSRNLSLSGMSFIEAGRSASAGCVDCNSSGVQAFGLTGTNSVTNSIFLRGRLRNFYISNPSGATTLNISGSTFDDTRGQGSPATDNLQIYTSGSASAAFNIANSAFLKSSTNQINAVAKDTSQITELDITGITMNNDGGPSAGVRIDGEGASTIAFNLNGNPVLYAQDENVVTVSVLGTAQMQGRIQNNPDMRFTTASPGGSVFGGIRALSDGSTSRVILDVSGNTLLVDNGTSGINPSVAGTQSARIDTRIANNTVNAAGAPGIPLDAISGSVNSGGTAKVLCTTLSGNTVGGNWVRAARLRILGPQAINIRHRLLRHFRNDLDGTGQQQWCSGGLRNGQRWRRPRVPTDALRDTESPHAVITRRARQLMARRAGACQQGLRLRPIAPFLLDGFSVWSAPFSRCGFLRIDC